MRRRCFHGMYRNVLLLDYLSSSPWSCKTWHRGAFRNVVDLLSSTIATTDQAPNESTADKRRLGHALLGLKGAEKPSNKDVHLLCRVFRHFPWSVSLEKNLRSLNFILTPHQLIQALHILEKESFAITLDFFIWSTQQRGFSQNVEVCQIMKKSFEENFNSIPSVLETMERNQRHIPLLVFMILMEIFAEKDMVDEAVEIFKSMNKFRCRPNEDAYNLILASLIKNGKIDTAQNIFKQMRSDRWCRLPKVAYYLLLYGLGKKGELGEARKIITEATKTSKHDVVAGEAYSHLLDGLCETGLMCLAEEVVIEMYELGFEPDAHVYISLICGHANVGNIEESYQYYVEAIHEQILTPSQEMFELLISGFCNHKGNIKMALKVFGEMMNDGFQLDAKLCDTMTRLMLEQKEWQVFEVFWGGLIENGMTLNLQLCDEIVKACVGSKRAHFALSILHHVVTHNDLHPSKETFESLIKILCELNQLDYWDKLLSVVDNMKEGERLEISARIMENVICLDQGVFQYISNFMEKRGMYKV